MVLSGMILNFIAIKLEYQIGKFNREEHLVLLELQNSD
jgi:hypothetical protein